MKKILFLLDNAFTNDRRVYREAFTLVKNGYSVTLLAVKAEGTLQKENINGIVAERIFNKDIFDIKKRNCFKLYANTINKKYDFDILHAHDQTMLHLAAIIKKNNLKLTLIYDSHELFRAWPINISNYNNIYITVKSWIVRKYQTIRERNNGNFIDHLITVNNSIADDLKSYFKLKNNPIVIRNVPERATFEKKSNILREKFNISHNTKMLVIIGTNIYRKTLNLEQVIDEFKDINNIAVVFICTFNENSKPINEYVKKRGINNVYFHNKIEHNQITEYLSSADIGLVPTWNKKDLSYWLALDNKLFEYIQSEIPILATQQPEYVNIVENYKCGVCVNPDNKNAYLNGFNEIIDNYSFYKSNTIKAKDDLCWENEENNLIKLYNKIN